MGGLEPLRAMIEVARSDRRRSGMCEAPRLAWMAAVIVAITGCGDASAGKWLRDLDGRAFERLMFSDRCRRSSGAVVVL